MTVSTPRLYLGTMTFGWSQTSSAVDQSVALKMLKSFMLGGHTLIDTARIYAGGKTESILGDVLRGVDQQERLALAVGTKAHPSQPNGLSPAGIRDQLGASLNAIEMDSVGEFYLHQPDPDASLLDSLRTTDALLKDGKIGAVGMSNYHSSEMERAFRLCEEHRLAKPTVYQGLYNPLNRMVELELIPVLRANGCSFVAYNPLAAGLLTGKHSQAEDGTVAEGRFRDNPNYLPRFYTDANFAAVEMVRKACDEEGITMVEATYRWLLRHSCLGAEDGLLLGASSLEQLDQNLKGCNAAKEKGPLPESILKAFEGAWNLTQDAPFPYWRSYSSDMPGRESLDQGASYSATKK